MNSPKVETDALSNQAGMVTVSAEALPQDVERFLTALHFEGVEALEDDSEDGPAAADKAFAHDMVEGEPSAVGRPGPAMVPTMPMPPPQPKPVRPVSAVGRAVLGTHLQRTRAMQPLADLLATVRERAAGNDLSDLKIVPPEPNPLKLTLHLSMTDGEFVVKVRTALDADRRDEVQQALHVLQTSLTKRLQVPARVLLA